ncbi:TorD/DmsD family molecular chaperone [Candidatus Endoriftia persephone]|jgi:TorA maturation chaperone TorD|uniref:Molecular chaperone TorD family protein n=1 Tax=Candidatus Endoriftia persephonae TaxID=393765 RepID=A0A9J7A0M8_9GAMM|nr:molecular chaperone TorD family protein [Candidatus Endoriftia persephone]USF88707.1 molecular chaperone TorD family protein [Candidatus Endoriftia persephone]
METDWKKLADSAKSRSEIYGLLTTVFREEPTEALIKELRGPRLSGAFSDMDVDLGETFYSDPEGQVADELAVEFTHLFLGPGPHISAHESIFVEVDGDACALWGAQTVEVKKFIETTGLNYEPGFTGLPDHVSVELEFLQKLTEWEADKWIQQNRKSAEYCLTVQRMFLERHLLCWLPQFCDAIMTQAEMPFYRAMAELTKNYMEFERQSIATDTAA